MLHYLHGEEDLGLFYKNNAKGEIIGYIDCGFKTNELSEKLQTEYIFIKNGALISWKSAK